MKTAFYYITLSILICFSSTSKGQEDAKKTIDLSHFGLSSNTYSYSNYEKKQKKTYIAFVDNSNLNILTLKEDFSATKDTINYILPGNEYSLVKGVASENSLQYLFTKKDGYMSFAKYDFETKEWSSFNKPVKEEEKYLGTLSYKNTLYILNYLKSKNSIRVYNIGSNKMNLYNDYNLSSFMLQDNNLDFFMKNRKKPIKKINSSGPNELTPERKKKKIYQFEEQVYITIEDSISKSVGLISLNLKNKKESTKYFSNKDKKCSETKYVKSTMNKNYIVVASGCEKDATINIYNLNSTKIVAKTYLNYDNLIKDKCYDNLISSTQAMSIEQLKSKVVLSKFISKDASLFISEKNDSLELIIGYTKNGGKSRKKMMEKADSKRKKGGGKGNGGGQGGGKAKKAAKMHKNNNKGSELTNSFLTYEKSLAQYYVCKISLSGKTFNTKTKYSNYFNRIKATKRTVNQHNVLTNLILEREGKLWYGYVNNISNELFLVKVK